MLATQSVEHSILATWRGVDFKNILNFKLNPLVNDSTFLVIVYYIFM